MPEIRADQRGAFLEISLSPDMSLIFSEDGGGEVRMNENTPENEAFSVRRLQLRRCGDTVRAAACTRSRSFEAELEIEGAAHDIAGSFCTRTSRQMFTIPQNVTRLMLEYMPKTGFTLYYEDAAACMEPENDPLRIFLHDEPGANCDELGTNCTPESSCRLSKDAAQLRSDLEQQSVEKMQLLSTLEQLRKQKAENEKSLALLRAEVEKLREMHEHREEQAYLDRLLKELDMDKNLVEMYRNAPTGSESEEELFNMFACQCAAAHETVRQLMAYRQQKTDLESVPASQKAGTA